MKSPAGFNLDGLSDIPVLSEGRVKPLLTVARASLLMLSGRQELDSADGGLGAEAWLMDALTKPRVADSYRIFLIDNPDLLSLLDLPASGRRRFAFTELEPSLGVFSFQVARAEKEDDSQRSRFDSAVLALAERLILYQRIKNAGLAGDLQGKRDAAFAVYPPEANAVAAYLLMLQSYREADAARFNKILSLDHAWLKSNRGVPWLRVHFEALFDRTQPFYRGLLLYLVAFLLLLVSLTGKSRLPLSSAYAVLGSAFLVHTAGLIARMLIQGRPPVTNLYSSAVFVGWAAVAAALLMERKNRDGSAAAAASIVGFATLIIAHHLAADGDTIEMMRAVLNSNFWLSTHVVAITLGYGAMFLASALGHIHVFKRLSTGKRREPRGDAALSGMIYGTVCLALFFSFLGTVLGGIWADQSWGRFWGWDPKENGALIIVLWDAVVLHAKLGGYLGEDGLAASAIAGGIITSLAWFGVDMLGIGLHSYGFTDAEAVWLLRFIGTELAILITFLWLRKKDAAAATFEI
ncbi:MAG TPA: cytochrome c biogenesis protein CcsA [Elusimicrobiota bacterium]|nr:cytochrome c biogenesis protein CcsA [Elusimicrobiota bacterium]